MNHLVRIVATEEPIIKANIVSCLKERLTHLSSRLMSLILIKHTSASLIDMDFNACLQRIHLEQKKDEITRREVRTM